MSAGRPMPALAPIGTARGGEGRPGPGEGRAPAGPRDDGAPTLRPVAAGVPAAGAPGGAPSLPDTLQRRRRRARLGLVGLAILLAGASLLAVGVGAVAISPADLLRLLASGLGLSAAEADAIHTAILWNIRLPRMLQGICTGAGLAVCGALLQGLFRNPLADPGLLGISGGAALAAAIAIVYGGAVAGWLGPAAVPLAAFTGALAVTLVVQRLARRNGRTDLTTLLLAGMAIAAISFAGTGMLTFLANDTQLRALSLWSLGSLGTATWRSVASVAAPVALVLLLALRSHRQLDTLLLGEREAHHLGISVEGLKRRLVILAALGVGACVAASGAIGFVGLVVPHLIRLSFGPSHRLLLPASALGGASLLLLADLLARTAAAPAELPIGAITALIGGPFFLFLLRGRASRRP